MEACSEADVEEEENDDDEDDKDEEAVTLGFTGRTVFAKSLRMRAATGSVVSRAIARLAARCGFVPV